MADHEAGLQWLGVGRHQPLEGRLAPGHEAVRWLLAHHLAALLGIVTGLGQRPLVLHDMLGCLHDHGACRVEAGPARPAGDLVELARLQQPGFGPVVLGQRGEQHGADRHVDADAEGIGAADDLEQARLGQRLHQPPVAGQHARVVHADAVPDQPRQRLAEARGEPEVADQAGDRVLLRAGAHVDAHQRLRLLDRGGPGEVHHVDRRLLGRQQLLERLVQRGEHVGEDQRHRTLGGADHGGRSAGAPGQVLLEPGHVAERGRHQHELRLRQLDQRHLPGPAPRRVGVEVELVHHHLADVGRPAVAQRDVGQYLGGAADHRRCRVHTRVTGHHADARGPEDVAQGEELLRHQRLDGRGVEAADPLGQGGEMRADGDQALPGSGRGAHDHVGAGDDLDQGLLLVRVQGEALLPRPGGEGVEHRVFPGLCRKLVDERHGPSIVPAVGWLPAAGCRFRRPLFVNNYESRYGPGPDEGSTR